MGVMEELDQIQKQRMQGGLSGAQRVANLIREQTARKGVAKQKELLKKMGKEYVAGGYYDAGEEGRKAFISKYGLDDDTMNVIHNVTDTIMTGGVDRGLIKGANNALYDRAGQMVAAGEAETPSNIEEALLLAKTPEEKEQLLELQKKYTEAKSLEKTTTPSSLGKLFQELDAIPETDTLRRKAYEQKIAKEISQTGMKFTVDKDGNVTLLTNASQEEVMPGTATETQKDIVGLMEQVENLDAISGDNAFTDVLTVQGKLYRKGLKIADSLNVPLSDENKEYLGKARQFTEGVEQIFNTYRKEITGAQAAIKELEMLRESVLNKKLTPTEFEYSVKRFRDQVTRSLRLKRMLLREGFSGENLSKKLDEMIVGGSDVTDTELDARGDELKAGGMSDAEVVAQLKKEGYL